MIREAMADIVERLAAAVPDERVTADPRNAQPPCVLVDLPAPLSQDTSLCGPLLLRHTVIVIGSPGTWAELGRLDSMLERVLAAVEFESCDPIGYVPHLAASEADAVTAYRITLNEYYPTEGA